MGARFKVGQSTKTRSPDREPRHAGLRWPIEGYVAALVVLLAIPIGAFATTRLTAFAAAENAGRLPLLHAGPVTRAYLLTAEVATTVARAAALATLAAIATWIGATAVGAGLPLVGTANVLPVAATTLAVGLAPRAVATIGMMPTAGGFLLKSTDNSTHAPRLGQLAVTVRAPRRSAGHDTD
ncbi:MULTISPECIES: hypothetical protein [unclassified Micromonospora]|uniref:hypothetical protein n=1 Tax=unclassified Micromonospora TaxID=2617518 RepID=UPI00098CFAE5|nr:MULTISPECIES: hypothetical protein [unclassified Micromonospora]MDI5936760.1 hypothetical protein [Micromonospora sp. DH15]OON28145.1 hypothetical protein BSA16_28270 [Micromonospora sp. Rc5]